MISSADSLLHADITGPIIATFYDVYNDLGPGFPEFVFRRAIAIALRSAGLETAEETPLPVWFRGERIVTFRADLVVQSLVLVEVKVSPQIEAYQVSQLRHYLKATDLEVGLLLNFGRNPQFQRVVYENARKRSRQLPKSEADTSDAAIIE
jgi:GxxExxY protein